jgi:hypothetical protein
LAASLNVFSSLSKAFSHRLNYGVASTTMLPRLPH